VKSNFTFSILLFALAFSASRSVAQIVDSALAYFPLGNGDQWEYSYRWAIQSNYTLYTIQVDGDTLMSNGRTYKKIVRRQLPNSPIQYTFTRIDSAIANLYTYDPASTGGESLLDSLRLKVGDSSHRYEILFRIDTASFLGITATTRDFGGFTGGSYYRVAYGFGLIYASEVSSSDYPYYTTLVYAKIDGHEYGTLLGVNRVRSALPSEFQLEQNYPDPFNPSTTIRFGVPTRSRVRLTIFNLLGQQVADLANEEMNAGSHERTWNASVASGLYFYRLEAVSVNDPSERFVDVKKMVFVK
jgi:hypothetical protein